MFRKIICWLTRRHKMNFYTDSCIRCGITKEEIKNRNNLEDYQNE